ncbi:MAG TPA: glycerophosphodiester phosphodiesterase [Rubrivivax sp.]|nr:glycerophosphodiester phosphodiesterase [Burkholderiales bacterium]HNT40250.1 glycerophosphodiester phosphodiesterase [Rubrivivax sp.]
MTALVPWPYPRWIAHRGAGTLAPENTLAAFRVGAAHGYRAFECDVKLSADGVLFLMHDTALERTTNGHGVGGELPWSALSQLDAGSWHGHRFAGEPLPTLAAVARWIRANGFMLDLEIKPTPGLEEATGRAVALAVRELWAGAAVPPLLTSFRPESLKAAREAAPELPRGLLLDTFWEGWEAIEPLLDCAAVITNHALMDAAFIARLHAQGRRALVYTVNEAEEARRLLDLGIDGIITDAIDRFAPAAE